MRGGLAVLVAVALLEATVGLVAFGVWTAAIVLWVIAGLLLVFAVWGLR